MSIDTTQVDKLLSTLESETTNIINEALKEVSEIYLKAVVQSLRREMGSAADRPSGKYKEPLSSGVSLWENVSKSEFGVNALKDYRLRFFEGGTNERYAKMKKSGVKAFRGRIKANHFFTKGINSQDINSLLETAILKAIRNKGISI